MIRKTNFIQDAKKGNGQMILQWPYVLQIRFYQIIFNLMELTSDIDFFFGGILDIIMDYMIKHLLGLAEILAIVFNNFIKSKNPLHHLEMDKLMETGLL